MDQNLEETTDQTIPALSDTSPYLRHSSRRSFSTFSVATLPQYSPFSDERLAASLVPPLDGIQYPNAISSNPDCFEYSHPNQVNKPWANLKLYTHDIMSRGNGRRYNQTKPRIPYVGSNKPLSGLIQLDIDSPMNIQQINLQLKGKIATSALKEGSYTFVLHTFPVWNQSMGDPQKPPQGMPVTPTKEKVDVKFNGCYSFPFTLPFPTYVDLEKKAAVFPPAYATENPIPESPGTLNLDSASPADKKGKKKRPWSFFSSGKPFQDANEQQERHPSRKEEINTVVSHTPMPQSFIDKSLRLDLNYEIHVVFVHGRLRPDTKIRAPIAYVPSSEPASMSFGRQQAYEAGALLPGPKLDPDGWYPVPKATVRGLFNETPGVLDKREMELDCVLYLANSLSYTRGTVIPCYLSLNCADANALEELHKTKAPDIRLIRKLHYLTPGVVLDAVTDVIIPGFDSHFVAGALPKFTGLGNGFQTTFHEVTRAVWWKPPKDALQDASERWLEGEIHLDPDLQPSSASSIFSVEYIVEIHPPKSTHFEPHASGTSCARDEPPLSSQVVEITTMHLEGEPVPVAFSEAPKTKLRALNVHAIQEGSE